MLATSHFSHGDICNKMECKRSIWQGYGTGARRETLQSALG